MPPFDQREPVRPLAHYVPIQTYRALESPGTPWGREARKFDAAARRSMNRSGAAEGPRTVSSTGSGPSSEPLARQVLRMLPTRALRRVVWDCIKYRKLRAIVPTRFSARLHCNTRDSIQRTIDYFGVWQPNITAWIGERLTPGDTFVDSNLALNAGRMW